jgi:hypothetical protein
MRVVKIFNNNTVLVSDEGTLAVVSGNGVGFAHKKGDELKFEPAYLKFLFDSGISNIKKEGVESSSSGDRIGTKDVTAGGNNVANGGANAGGTNNSNTDVAAGGSNIEESSAPTGTIQRYLDLLREIPDEIFDLCAQIIGYAKIKLPRSFSDSVFFTLADHLNFAIGRKALGLNLQNALTIEIQVFYPEEYDVGETAVGFIKDKLNVEF